MLYDLPSCLAVTPSRKLTLVIEKGEFPSLDEMGQGHGIALLLAGMKSPFLAQKMFSMEACPVSPLTSL